MNGLRFRAVRPAEIPLAAAQSLAAFGGAADEQPEVEQRFRAALDAGELWGVDADGLLVGHCRLLVVDHFFGGRPVRSMDVAGVAVARDRRRQGIATALMESAAAWGAHQGIALSLLFPGVPSLYRRLGWEIAGSFPRYVVGDRLLPPRAEAMRPANPADWPQIEACYERWAATLNGPGRRRAERWERLRDNEAQYVLDGGDGVEAYVLLYRGAEPGENPSGPPTIDWAAATPRGMRAVVGLLAGSTLDSKALVRAPEPVSWAPWTDEWHVPDGSGLYWMARPLVLRAAIAARGFPRGVTGAVTFAVDDTLLAETRGPWRLEVADGRGALEPSLKAAVLMDARAAGPLFTGFRTPQQLALAGLLDGPPAELEVLSAMFGGSPPVALDFF